MKPIQLSIIDDHKLFREGIKLLFSDQPEYEIVFESDRGKEILNRPELLKESIILMDIELPDMNGIELTRIILEQESSAKIIALSMYESSSFYEKMIEAGASGYLVKNSDIDTLTQSIRDVHEGKKCFPSDILIHLLKEKKRKLPIEDLTELSNREIEILSLIAQGFSNTEIAEKLFISKRTVDKHRANLLEKTGTKNTASLIMYGIKRGYIATA